MSNVSRNIVVMSELFKKASKNFPALHYVVTSIDISDKFENLNLQKIAYIPNALYIASCHLTSYSLLPQFIIISCGVYPVGQHINKIGFRVYPHTVLKPVWPNVQEMLTKKQDKGLCMALSFSGLSNHNHGGCNGYYIL